MAMEMRQQLKLSQQLVMTPQLRQAIKILQVSRTELETLIDEELKKAEEAIKAGMDASEYYQKAVVEKGKKSV